MFIVQQKKRSFSRLGLRGVYAIVPSDTSIKWKLVCINALGSPLQPERLLYVYLYLFGRKTYKQPTVRSSTQVTEINTLDQITALVEMKYTTSLAYKTFS